MLRALIPLALLAVAAAPPGGPALDVLGDPLPPGAVARMGSARLRHTDLVTAVAYEPKGRFVAAAEQRGAVTLWDAKTGRAVIRLREPGATCRFVAYSPDGRALAVAQGAGLLVWDVKDGRPSGTPRQLLGHAGDVTSAVFTADGASLISGGLDGPLRVWDVKTGNPLRSFGGGTGRVISVALSPDGRMLATANHVGDPGKTLSAIRLWDLAAGTHLRALAIGRPPIYRLAFSPDGKALASGGADGATVWDVATGRELLKPAKRDYTPCVAFTPGGKSLIAGGSGFLHERRIADGRLVRSFDTGVTYTYAAAFSADGKTLATGGTRSVGLWDAATAKPLHESSGHDGDVLGVLFTPDGKELLTGGYGPSIFRWDAATGRRVGKLDGPHNTWNGTLALSPDGKTLAALGPNLAVVLLDAKTAERRKTFTKHLPPRTSAMTAMSVVFAPDGQTVFSATQGVDHSVRRWETATGKELLAIPTGKGGTSGLALSPDGRTLYSASLAGPVRAWDVATGTELRQIGTGAKRLALSPDGRLLAAVADGGVGVWDAATGREMYRLPPLKGYVWSVAFAPDGRTLVTVGEEDDRVRFWEVATGKLRLELPARAVKALAFSPDGRRLATAGGDTTAVVWDFHSLALQRDGTPGEWVVALSGENAEVAFRAVCSLARSERGVAALARLLGRADAKAVAALIAQLDDERVEVRREAMRQLASMGTAAEAALKKVVADATDPDLRLRAGVVLREMAVSPDGLRLRGLRALEALEAAGTAAARGVLEEVAKGDAEAELTREARAALKRMRAVPRR